ncbi:MAG: protein kinase [Planctomycetes bacterium]|nr:protein kinase [Planctomycetota bacterium]
MEFVIGDVLGKCRLIEWVGDGGNGEVWLAKHMNLDTTVALKILNNAYYDTPKFIEKFYNEAQQLVLMDHPNIVRVFDVDFDRGYHYIVMQYVDGPSLKSLIREKPLSIKEAIGYILQTLVGLDYAHKHGIIHRDIKLDNLMIAKDGTVKIGDFGLVRKLNTATDKNLKDEIFGTAEYMPVEQWVNFKKVSFQGDIFAVGITFFKLITGRFPVEDKSPMGIIKKLVDNERMQLSSLLPEVNPELEKIINKSIEINPKNRYQSAISFSKALVYFCINNEYLDIIPSQLYTLFPSQNFVDDKFEEIEAKVLIIDDDPYVHIFMKKFIESVPAHFIGATNGNEGIDIARRERPNLIIIDHNMPEMSGVDVLRKLQSDDETNDIDMWMLTSLDDEDLMTKAYEEGITDYIVKPVFLNPFVAKVRRFFKSKKKNLKKIKTGPKQDTRSRTKRLRSKILEETSDINESKLLTKISHSVDVFKEIDGLNTLIIFSNTGEIYYSLSESAINFEALTNFFHSAIRNSELLSHQLGMKYIKDLFLFTEKSTIFVFDLIDFKLAIVLNDLVTKDILSIKMEKFLSKFTS